MEQITPILSGGFRGLTEEQIAASHKYISGAQPELTKDVFDVLVRAGGSPGSARSK